MVDEVSLVIGGAAGDGVRQVGNIIGRTLNRQGLYTFVLDDYQSLIRGGHNFVKIRASPGKIWSHYDEVDLIVALNNETVDKHKYDLNKSGRVLFDSGNVNYESDNGLSVPFYSMVEEVEGVEIMRNSVAVGTITFLYDLNLNIVKDLMNHIYGDRSDKNITLAEMGFNYAKENDFEKITEIKSNDRAPAPFLTGNEAISFGAAKAGLKVYMAYPMTPSTSILHTLASYQEYLGLTVIQPENEIGVINMALGSAYAGARTMIGTSGGGFALMQEAISLAGMSETPILIVECQRSGPSTGVPTYTAQADLEFVLNSGHGEFPLIVLAPGDTEEAFYRSGEALNLAWKFQTPVILLSDKHLSESRKTSFINENKVNFEYAKLNEDKDEDYKRYSFTEDGVSHLAFPGAPGLVVKSNSYEHDEQGYTTEKPDEIASMQEKRLRKSDSIKREIKGMKPVNTYGDEDADVAIVAWGSTKGAVLDALNLLDKSIKFVQPVYLKPFPEIQIKEELAGVSRIICVEVNSTGQLANLLKDKTGIEVNEKILKYDARPFDPLALTEDIRGILK